MKLQTLTALSISMLLAASAHADVAGSSSNTAYIQVGGTELTEDGPIDENDPGHTGEIGSSGIGVYTSKTPYKKVALSGLQGLAKAGFGATYNWSKKVAYIDETNPLMELIGHGDYGHYAFSDVKVDDNTKIYFGEWSDEDDINDGSHTVYYVGKDKTNNMPSTGTASYSVRGINNARNTNPLTGTLNANFGTNKIGGSLSNDAINLVIDNNTINPTTASFSGKALANGNNGNSQGEFFGNDAAALGGIATFEDSSLDTAFAGKRGPITP